LPTPVGNRPQMALFLPPPRIQAGRRRWVWLRGVGLCAYPPTISGRRGRRVVRGRGSAEGELLAAPAPFVHGEQALAERLLERPVRASHSLEQELEVARQPLDVRARLMGCISPPRQSSARRRVRRARCREGQGLPRSAVGDNDDGIMGRV